ncbi:hypothetical protein QCA50_000827 [Cerrena zonata]|uniref:Uncharacterized protein n=1 Tax=Cerrena zonata TaxID=2478898 RepID=A0AAW0GUB9_9APHY
MPSSLAQEVTSSRRHTPVPVNRPRSRSPVGPRSRSPGNLGVPQRSHSQRTITSDRGSDRGNRTSDSGDISIRIEPPSGPGSAAFSPVVGDHSDLLSPNAVHAPLSQPSAPEPEVPTVPNSPATRHRYPSVGVMPSEPGGPPLGFMPTGVAGPYPNIVPNGSGGIPPPLAQSSPKQPIQNIYGGWNPDPRSAPMQRSSSAAGYGSESSGRHTRTQSLGQSQSRPGTAGPSVRPPSVRPPSAGPQQRVRTPQPAYETAPTPPHLKYPLPPPRPDPANMSPQSISSNISSGGHHRSLSMNAGSTPATAARPLSNGHRPKLRRVPSAESIMSATSKGEYSHYQPNEYVDAAFLASPDELTSIQSPTTAANTRANATFGAALANAGRSSSPAASFSTSSLPRSRKVSGPSRLR